MKVILLENIKSLGKIGDAVEVKRGHARNFLIKYGKALKVSESNISLVNKKKAELDEKNINLKKNAKKTFDIINKKNISFLKEQKIIMNYTAVLNLRKFQKVFKVWIK